MAPKEHCSGHLHWAGGAGPHFRLYSLSPGGRGLRRLQSFQGGGRIPNPFAGALASPSCSSRPPGRDNGRALLGCERLQTPGGPCGAEAGGGRGRGVEGWGGKVQEAQPSAPLAAGRSCVGMQSPVHSRTFQSAPSQTCLLPPREGPPGSSLVVPAP